MCGACALASLAIVPTLCPCAAVCVVRRLPGALAIFAPSSGGYAPEDLLVEAELGKPVLQVCVFVVGVGVVVGGGCCGVCVAPAASGSMFAQLCVLISPETTHTHKHTHTGRLGPFCQRVRRRSDCRCVCWGCVCVCVSVVKSLS
jgi:hypothetical protein